MDLKVKINEKVVETINFILNNPLVYFSEKDIHLLFLMLYHKLMN